MGGRKSNAVLVKYNELHHKRIYWKFVDKQWLKNENVAHK